MALTVPQINFPDEIIVSSLETQTFVLGVYPVYADGDTKHPLTFAWQTTQQEIADGNVGPTTYHATDENVVEITVYRQFGTYSFQCTISNGIDTPIIRTKTVRVGGLGTGYINHDVANNPGWLWDNGYDYTGLPSQSQFSKLKFTTNADKFVIKGESNWGPITQMVAGGIIGVKVDGVVKPDVYILEGFSDILIEIGNAGTNKTVELVIAQMSATGGTTPTGSYINKIRVPAGTTFNVIMPPTVSNRWLIYGDSIQCASGFHQAFLSMGQRLINEYGQQQVIIEAWGGRSLRYDAETTQKRDAFVNRLISYQPSHILFTIGSNDAGFMSDVTNWNSTHFLTRYAEVIDALHAEFPSVHIFCQSLTWRGDFPGLTPYREGIEQICSTRSWTTYINGLSLIPSSEMIKTDGLHPDGIGHGIYAENITPILGLTKTVTATSRYVDSAIGNDGNNGLTPQTAWLTIDKVNNATLPLGTTIYLNGKFYEQLNVPRSGTIYNPLIIKSLDANNKAEISGAHVINPSSWTLVGNGVYKTTPPTISYKIQLVKLNGVDKHKGRWPRPTTTESYTSGYAFADSGVGTSTLTDSDLAGKNYVGAEIITKRQEWLFGVQEITSHTGSTISFVAGQFSNTPTFPLLGDGRYFLQNHPSLLEEVGEWSHNESTNEFFMYFGGLIPSSQIVEISARESCIKANNKSALVIRDVKLSMANLYTTYLPACNLVTLDNIEVTESGFAGVLQQSGSMLKVINSSFNNTVSSPLYIQNIDHVHAINNDIQNVGLIDGKDASNGLGPNAMFIFSGDWHIVDNNRIRNVAYNGIALDGTSYTTVTRNHVYNYCRRQYDGGGIYVHDLSWHYNAGYRGGQYARKRKANVCSDNIMDNTMMFSRYNIGALYMDDGTNGWYLHDNTEAGTYFHSSHKTYKNIKYENNLAYDIQLGGSRSFTSRSAEEPNVLALTHINNKYVQKYPTNQWFEFGGVDFNTPDYYFPSNEEEERIRNAGTINNNLFVRCFGTDFGGTRIISKIVGIAGNLGTNDVKISIKGWRDRYGHDLNSTLRHVRPQYNITSIGTRALLRQFTSGLTENGNSVVAGGYSPNVVVSWDATSPLDSGAAKIEFSPVVLNGGNYQSFVRIGVSNGTFYPQDIPVLIKLSVYATAASEILIRMVDEPESWSDQTFYYLEAGRNELEVIITPTVPMNSFSIRFGNEASGPFWVDNIQVYNNLVYTENNPDQYSRFEKNPSDTPKVVTLDQPYLDVVENVVYSGTVTIPARRARVLMSDTPIVETPTLPTVSAGSNQTLASGTTSVNLSGTATGETSVLWTRQSGPNTPTIVSATSKNTSVTGLVAGTYLFNLAATNVNGTSNSTVTIVINAVAGSVPVVNAGSDQSLPSGTTTATLNATVTGATSYLWTRISGPNTPTITTPTAEDTTLTGMIAGTYIYRLTATNTTGSAFDDISIVIASAPSSGDIVIHGLYTFA